MFRVLIWEMYFQNMKSYFKAEDKHCQGNKKLPPACMLQLCPELEDAVGTTTIGGGGS